MNINTLNDRVQRLELLIAELYARGGTPLPQPGPELPGVAMPGITTVAGLPPLPSTPADGGDAGPAISDNVRTLMQAGDRRGAVDAYRAETGADLRDTLRVLGL